jgi:hypothetical protein
MSKVFVILIAALTLSACVSKPIYNVDNRAFNTEEIIPMDVLQKRIRIIGAERGWGFKVVSPGHLIGNVGTAKHKATVDLTFNQKTFSIKYLESHNLKATNGTIHHRYNRWIELLEHDLVTKVGLMSLK